ncbi:hypothetical protein OEV98_10925 [Caldibacillus lycopersici]|uniref:Peptidase S74 domain-containing protein n=1 Tax=Perspicuibacillus lycopersici TaxID=1325689 RepID=A0AAE3ITW1_9BACI|nr:phage tail spike protein [Perspicuibacillus lycopersici]MCU9614072.1 hypothetical protein [Perspicuibacillus lycopersici]
MIHILDKQTDAILTFLKSEVIEAVHEEDIKYVETFDFAVVMNDKAKYVQGRNRVVIQADDGSFHEFIIRQHEKIRNGVRGYSDASFLDLDKQKIISPVDLNGQTVISAADFVLTGTEWQVGEVEYAGIRSITFDNQMGAFQALKRIASIFGLEMRFRVEIKGNKIVGRYVDFFVRRGQFRGKEVTFGKDLIDITRIEKNDVVTALYCVGPERLDGTRLTTTVVDNEALQRWGRNGKHLWAIYEPESYEPDMTLERLTTLGEQELAKRINSVVQYETTQSALDKVPGLGHEKVYFTDTIRVKDTSFVPPLYLEARAIRVKRDLLNPSQKNYILGEFIEYSEEDVRKRFKELQNLYGTKIIKSPTEPKGKFEAIWIKTGVVPEIGHTWDGNKWTKLTPTDAMEVGAETPEGAQEKAILAENNAKSHADIVAVAAEGSAKTFALNEADKARLAAIAAAATDTESKVRTAKTALEESIAEKADATNTYTKIEVDNALESKVSVTKFTTDMQGVISDIEIHENRIALTEEGLLSKVSSTTYNQKIYEIETNIGSKADTSKVTAIETRLSTAETNISQTNTAIELKANKTDVYTKTEVNSALGSKADNSAVMAIEERVDTAEATITAQAGEIRLKANATSVYTKSETDTKLNSKADQSSLDTANGKISILTTRITTAESELEIQADQIASKVSQTTYDVDIPNLKTRMESAESSIVQQADSIESKVSKTDFNGNTIASLINQTATSVQISAAKISLSGDVEIINGRAVISDLSANKITTGILGASNGDSSINLDTGAFTLHGSFDREFSGGVASYEAVTESYNGALRSRLVSKTYGTTKMTNVTRWLVLSDKTVSTQREVHSGAPDYKGARFIDFFADESRTSDVIGQGMHIYSGQNLRMQAGYNIDIITPNANFTTINGGGLAVEADGTILALRRKTAFTASSGAMLAFQSADSNWQGAIGIPNDGRSMHITTYYGGYIFLRTGTEVRAVNVDANAYVPLRAASFPTGSLEEYKQDIKRWDQSALDLIRNSTIYEYRLKEEVKQGINKVRQGLVIGKGYNTPSGVIDGDGVEQYLMNSWSWKAIQELDANAVKVNDEVEWLKLENQYLKQKVTSLEAKIMELEAKVA